MNQSELMFIDAAHWEMLAVEPTGDLKAIKRAYARQIRTYNPEEHPERFIQIREAYEAITTILEDWRDFQPVLEEHTDLDCGVAESEDSGSKIEHAGQPEFDPNFDPLPAFGENFQNQINRALQSDRGDLAVQTLEQLIRSHSKSGIARQRVYQAIMRATLEGKLSDAMVCYFGWHWFFANHSFQFNFQADPEELAQFADLLYQAMTDPIGQVVATIEKNLDRIANETALALIRKSLENPQFDQLEMRSQFRLALIRVLAPRCRQFSNLAILELNDMLNLANVNDCQDNEDWQCLRILLQNVDDARAGTRLSDVGREKFDDYQVKFAIFLFLFVLLGFMVLNWSKIFY